MDTYFFRQGGFELNCKHNPYFGCIINKIFELWTSKWLKAAFFLLSGPTSQLTTIDLQTSNESYSQNQNWNIAKSEHKLQSTWEYGGGGDSTIQNTEPSAQHLSKYSIPSHTEISHVDYFNRPPPPQDSVNSEHLPVRNEGKYTKCYFCLKNKVKTKSGWRVNTHFKCQKCNVPLCYGQNRNCFFDFHKTLALEIGQKIYAPIDWPFHPCKPDFV